MSFKNSQKLIPKRIKNGKGKLISGSIWDEYSQNVQDRMNNPKHMGEDKRRRGKRARC